MAVSLGRRAGLVVTAACLITGLAGAQPPAAKKANDTMKEVAGTAEFLRSVPKHFATLKAIDVANHRVTLLLDGESLPKIWSLTPDAEIKVAGWWGRLDQLPAGDRVWVWFKTDRRQQPVALSMLADELSEQDIHGSGIPLVRRDAGSITLKPFGGKGDRTLKAGKAEIYRGTARVGLDRFKPGEKVFVQSSADAARLILDPAAFEVRRAAQKAALRKRWTDEGLPGTVSFLHIFSGEMDLMLDHEAMRWGRSLKVGDKVQLQAQPPIPAVVKEVRPWRERTQVRLVVNGVDQADLVMGQRLKLHMATPPAEVDTATLPPDIGRPRTKPERVEWFLASIYCTCGVPRETCTGHFYTLASCNPNGCGMPNQMRKDIAEKIDKGMTDQQIFMALLKEYGPNLVRPHLQP
jgi:hypothetical protein